MAKNPRFLLRILAFVLVFVLVLGCAGCDDMVSVQEEPVQEEPVDPGITPPAEEFREGYLSAAALGIDFVACGTDGRLDIITPEGEVKPLDPGTAETLTNVFVDGNVMLVSGTNGTLLLSEDGGSSFEPLELNADNDLNGAVLYQNAVYAAGEGGIIFRQNPGGWEPIQMDSENEIISLVATNYCVAAVTAESDVYFSPDGMNWDQYNFNEFYHGLYPSYVFIKAVGAGGTVFVLGYHEENPNTPVIMYTEMGEVWMSKELSEVNGAPLDPEQDMQVNDICFNTDQIVGVMNGGRILNITDCVVCNEEKDLEVQNDLWATAATQEGVLVCGADFYYRVLDSKLIRQDKIGAEQARADIEQRGAVLIDVREADELAADGYIPGSIHVPLAEVEAQLPNLVPDYYTEIIFYCASGMRSQTATELATGMGYYSVYNLGGLSDWPYEIVKD
ncbi:MAG: rhodanese-like domain-containing protein [Ruminococcaceae bacterium]|nr:rhodanese-like domain-containing protein [Oscillospiraceae bacterium]